MKTVRPPKLARTNLIRINPISGTKRYWTKRIAKRIPGIKRNPEKRLISVTTVIPVTKKIPTRLVKRATVVKIVKLVLVIKKIPVQIKEIIAPLAKRAPAVIVLGQNL